MTVFFEVYVCECVHVCMVYCMCVCAGSMPVEMQWPEDFGCSSVSLCLESRLLTEPRARAGSQQALAIFVSITQIVIAVTDKCSNAQSFSKALDT